MKCDFCNTEMVNYKDECFFCDGEGCKICNKEGELNIVKCVNEDCVSPVFREDEDEEQLRGGNNKC